MKDNKKVKVKSLRWELVPVYKEIYIDVETLEEVEYDEDELEDFFENEVLGEERDFIYTSDFDDDYYNNADYKKILKGELEKFYTKHNEWAVYLSSTITIDDKYTVLKDYDKEWIDKQLQEISSEFNELEVVDIKTILRDRKIDTLLKK
jgi:hypothetical protein